MGVKIIAVCDREAVYVSRFLAAVQSRLLPGVELQGATSWESIKKMEGVVDYWIVGEAFWDENFLKRYEKQCLLLSSGIIPEKFAVYPAILKYQQKDKLLREIFRSEGWNRLCFGERRVEAGTMEICMVYAPAGMPKQSLFSLAYAFEEAKHRRVLYVNLQEHSGMYALFEWEKEAHIGDLACKLRQEGKVPDLQGYVHSFGPISVILPVQQGIQATEITEDDLKRMFHAVSQQGICELLIVDMGRMPGGFWQIYARCHKHIIVYGKSSVEEAARQQFLDQCRLADGQYAKSLQEFCWQEQGVLQQKGETLLEMLQNGIYARQIKDWMGGERDSDIG